MNENTLASVTWKLQALSEELNHNSSKPAKS